MTDEELIAFRETPHIPTGTPDELVDDIVEIMDRIPFGWGKWISCDPGWFPLLAELNNLLRRVCPDYELHQVKEKFGTLRYYIGMPPLPELDCCVEFGKVHPKPERNGWGVPGKYSEAEKAEVEAEWEAYHPLVNEHHESEEHASYVEAQNPLRQERREIFKILEAVVHEYERRSAHTCELCGLYGWNKAGLHTSRGGWYKTLCSDCAVQLGYEAVKEDED